MIFVGIDRRRYLFGHTPLQLLTILWKIDNVQCVSQAHYRAPHHQLCETRDGSLREPASFADIRLDVTQHSKHMATEFRGAANQYGQGWSARPEDNSRIKEGQKEDNSRTREDKRSIRPATEPGHRGVASQCGQGRWAWPEDNSRTREGQQQRKRRTRPGHRGQGRGQPVWPALF